MEITCEHCDTKLNIPDEKIPKGQVVRVNCPKCKRKISINTEELNVKSERPKPARDSEQGGSDYGDYSDDEPLEFYEEGAKLALILNPIPEVSAKIEAELEPLGYHCVLAPNTRDAVAKMRLHLFDLVILSDGFDGQDLNNSPIIHYFNHVSISDRRKVFLVLTGDGFKTMDNLMAFAKSANAVINPRDIDKLSVILKRAIADHEKFYKVFMDTLVEVGKA
jgi:predicted Zn finger-like uncharacterized protein